MGAPTTWSVPPAGARYGLSAGGAATNQTSETASLVTPSVAGQSAAQMWHPDSPIFWIGALAAVTFGLMAVSTNVRVGKTTASVALGKA